MDDACCGEEKQFEKVYTLVITILAQGYGYRLAAPGTRRPRWWAGVVTVASTRLCPSCGQ